MSNTEIQYIGVIAAEVNSIEQREIMKGIIHEAQALGKRTIVFSNLYNPYETDESLILENSIYELMYSPMLSGLVLIAESFTNPALQKKVRDMISKRQDIPIVIIGIFIPSLAFPNVRFINASDSEDIMEITNHLINVHHFTKIDILTGMEGNEASEQRVQGYRRALEMHGIPYDERRVHYGDFWFTSGEALAKDFIHKRSELPQALVCCNDYMAYGVLDTFLQNGVKVPEDITVTGYEFIHERVFHSPLLSTYQRGRNELGSSAIQILDATLNEREMPPFYPPKGCWISGNSCSCGASNPQLNAELETLRVKQMYDKWNVLGTMEQQLTLCGTLDELIEVLSKHHYWVRWVQNMYLCLFENWYDTNSDMPGTLLSCRSVMPWNTQNPPIVCTRYDFSALYLYAPATAVHYYLPLFFENHFFGYFVLEYHSPDTYDDIFRNWMKSISIGLTFLCMKNDIRYLLQCQNLSEQHDSLTGLLNRRGTESSLSACLSEQSEPVYAIMIKLCGGQDTQMIQSDLLQRTAEVLRMICGQNGFCGRIDSQLFIYAGFSCESESYCDIVARKFVAVLLHSTGICSSIGMESLLIQTAKILPGESAGKAVSVLQSKIDADTAAFAAKKKNPHAEALYTVRNLIYQMETCDTDSICRQYSFSTGYFRQIYKDFFGISFHQDVIQARICRSIYLLVTTVRSIASIAEECGYEDSNYFLRQFQKLTGLTPGQFRKRI